MPATATRSIRILLVEDAEDDAFFTTRALKAIPQVTLIWRARSGEEAVCYLRAQLPFSNREQFPPPDLIILDIQMAGLDGLGVLKALHDLPDRPKVLVFSNRNDMPSVEAAFALGADAYHSKTQDPSKLARILDSLGWLPRSP